MRGYQAPESDLGWVAGMHDSVIVQWGVVVSLTVTGSRPNASGAGGDIVLQTSVDRLRML